MAEYWDKPGWNYEQSTVEYAETTTGKDWDPESVMERVSELEHLLDQNDGLVYDDYEYFRKKFDEGNGERA